MCVCVCVVCVPDSGSLPHRGVRVWVVSDEMALLHISSMTSKKNADGRAAVTSVAPLSIAASAWLRSVVECPDDTFRSGHKATAVAQPRRQGNVKARAVSQPRRQWKAMARAVSHTLIPSLAIPSTACATSRPPKRQTQVRRPGAKVPHRVCSVWSVRLCVAR